MSASRKARDLVRGSLQLISVIGVAETPTAEDLSDALSSLTGMLETWSTERLTIFRTTREVFPLVSGQKTYTMGPGGDFDTDAPVTVQFAGLQLTTSTPQAELDLRIITVEQNADIVMKDMQSTIPRDLYVENGAPFTSLTFYPVPTFAHEAVIYSQKQLIAVNDANTDLVLPSGYWEAMKYGLAIELAPLYGKEPSQTVVSQFMKKKAAIKRANFRPVLMKGDRALMGRSSLYNIFTGGFDR